MEGESRSVLPPAKRLKTEDDVMSIETPAAAEEMSSDTDGGMWSPSEDVLPYEDPDNLSPFDEMMDEYEFLDHELRKLGHKVYLGQPVEDKEYLFLFCKLMCVDENYLKVLADKNIIESWSSEDTEKTHKRLVSGDAMPESLRVANEIVDEHDMALTMKDMICCLKDLLTDWGWRMRIRVLKEFEKYLLQFWKENNRVPTFEEIDKFRVKWAHATSAKFGRNCLIYLIDSDISQGEYLLLKLLRGITPISELEGLIENNYKRRLCELCECRPHYINLKLEKAEESGLDKKIGMLFPSFKKLEVPRMKTESEILDMDLDSCKVLRMKMDLREIG